MDLNTKVPVLSWAKPEDIDSGSLEQIKNLANLPFAYHHVALMPDVHVGYGMPIGGVLASVDYIVPNAVGVDIGCGMVAVKTSITKEEFLALRGEVGHEISRAIPRGFRKYSEPQDEDNEIFKNIPPIDLILREIGNAKLQLGTLGSGNHFIDVLFDGCRQYCCVLCSMIKCTYDGRDIFGGNFFFNDTATTEIYTE